MVLFNWSCGERDICIYKLITWRSVYDASWWHKNILTNKDERYIHSTQSAIKGDLLWIFTVTKGLYKRTTKKKKLATCLMAPDTKWGLRLSAEQRKLKRRGTKKYICMDGYGQWPRMYRRHRDSSVTVGDHFNNENIKSSKERQKRKKKCRIDEEH